MRKLEWSHTYNKFTFYYLDVIIPKKLVTFLNGEMVKSKKDGERWFKLAHSKKCKLIYTTVNE